ncbi:MAG: CsgG/HfaB family protein [Candidatus Omnitrophota bacterium]
MKSNLARLTFLFALIIIFAYPVVAANCPHCGFTIKDDYKFCGKCGKPIDDPGPSSKYGSGYGQECARLPGPKKTIAVVGFDNAAGIDSLVDLGDDFSTQLTDALIQSDKFTVVSRTELDSVLLEQDYVASGRFAKAAAAQKAKAIPAQILVVGKITEFEHDSEGGSQGLTIKGITIGGNKSNAHIAVIVQIIDSTTGEVLDSKRVEGMADASGFNIGYSGSWSIGSSNFKATPLGKATQIAIDRCVNYISDKLSELPWKGRVVTVKDGLVYVNAGENSGITTGMAFSVYREGESLVDPETGIELGAEKSKIGDIYITDVQPKFSKAKITNSTSEINRADLVLEQ